MRHPPFVVPTLATKTTAWRGWGTRQNNPLSGTDLDGHFGCCSWAAQASSPILPSNWANFFVGFVKVLVSPLYISDCGKASCKASLDAVTPKLNGPDQVAGGLVGALLLPGFGGSATVTAEATTIETESVQLTTLFRAVDSTEMEDLQSTRTWNPSLDINGAQGKGFFYSQDSAAQFGAQQSATGGPSTSVITSTAPTDMVNSSYQQTSATEGPAVFIENQNLPQVIPQVPPQQ